MPVKTEGLEELTMTEELGHEEKATQAQRLIKLARASADFFHTPEMDTYADIQINGHRETWPLRGKVFRNCLRQRFFETEERPPGGQALQDAVEYLEAVALFEGEKREVYTRIAEYDGKIYLDLANDCWEAVEISPAGWQVITNPPVRFRRSKGMLPLPRPKSGGKLEELALFLNINEETSFILVIAWLAMALRPAGPYPVLVLQGEQGAAKSTTARVLRELIDPNTAPLRTVPRDERDLAIAAANSWIIALDNLSGISSWLSDGLCRLATGGGFATRKLYTDEEEAIFNYCRPIVVNGIDDIVSRHDLLDRCLIINLPSIPESKRVDEETFWREFREARPRILGALLDAVSAGLRNINSVKLGKYPRMADFAKWVTACEPTLPWQPGEFMAAYIGNRAEAVDLALETDLVAAAVKALLEKKEAWEGTATELLAALEEVVPEQTRRSKSWPKTAKGLGNNLRRAASFLRQSGVEVEFYRESGSGSRRLIRLNREFCVANVANVAGKTKALDFTSFEGATQTATQNCFATQNVAATSQAEALIIKKCDERDHSDANFPTQSKNIEATCPTCSIRSGEKKKKQLHILRPSPEWPGWLEVICQVCGGKRYIKEGDSLNAL